MLWELTAKQLLLSFSFVCCATFIGGWLFDKILGYSGFTVIGNWLLLLIGAYVGMYAYNRFGFRFTSDAMQTIVVTSASACGMLTMLLGFKLAMRA